MKHLRPAETYPPPFSWTLDIEWLEAFAEKLPHVDVVSFDVFDTAISRRVDAPVDVFALAEKYLVDALGRDFEKFAEIRELAETDARGIAAASGFEEIRFDEIYAALVSRLRAAEDRVPLVKKAELDAERAVLFGVPEIQEAVGLAATAGKRIAFVSDTYLPSDIVCEFLETCGYGASTFADVLVSSKLRKTKARGTIWDALKQRLSPKSRILHIGDDSHSDDVSPRAHGIAALPFVKLRSERRRGGPLHRDILPFSFAARQAHLRDQARDSSAFMTSFGASWGAVVVGSFVKWLEARLQHLKIDHLFFLARDGWLVQRAWEAAESGCRTGVTSSYLSVSRRALYLAQAALPAEDGCLTEEALDLLVNDAPLPLRTLLTRANLLGCDALVSDTKRAFGTLDSTVEWPKGVKTLRALLQRHHKAVLRTLQPALEATLAYFAQEGVDDRRLAIVDLGWNGSIQTALCNLMRARGLQSSLFGFYYSIWSYAQRRRPAAGWMEGAFGNDYMPMEEQVGLNNAAGFLENLHSSSIGTTTGYVFVNGNWQPETKDSPIEQQQHAALLAPFQDATVSTIQELFQTGRIGELRLSSLDTASGRLAIERVALSPSSDELRYLGSIRHARYFDHSVYTPIIPNVAAKKDLRRVLADPILARDWPVGSNLVCLSKETEPCKRASISAHFRPLIAHLDQRTLRTLS